MKNITLYPLSDESLRTRLFLHGVLAVMPEFVRLLALHEKDSWQADYGVLFSTTKGWRSGVYFQSDQAQWIGDKHLPNTIHLHFFTHRQLNNLFLQRGNYLPVPLSGWTQMYKLQSFKKLAENLNHYLKPNKKDMLDPGMLEIHVRISLALIVHALKELATHEAYSAQLLGGGPEGLLTFAVGRESEWAWIDYQRNNTTCGLGKPSRQAEVCVRFANCHLAADVLADHSDALAEVGLGNIQVEGLAPLADNLGYVMQRIRRYLDTCP